MDRSTLPPMSSKSFDSAIYPVSPPKTGSTLPSLQLRPVLPLPQGSIADWTRTSDAPRTLPSPKQDLLAGRAFRLPSFSLPSDGQLSPPFSDSRSSSSERDRSPDMLGGHYAGEARALIDERFGPLQIEGRINAGPSRYGAGPPGPMAQAAPASSGLEANGNRRQRVLMEPKQTSALLELWNKTYFPSTAERDQLAKAVGLAPRQVQVWFQNQRQKQRRVLHDPSSSQEERARLAELRHSPRTRRRLALAAQRDPNMSDEDYGLSPMSTDAQDLARCQSDYSRPLPQRSYSSCHRNALDIEMHPGWAPTYQAHHAASDYAAAFPSKEYVPPKAIVARTARSAARYQDEAPSSRPHLWSDVPGRLEDIAAQRRHSVADHVHPAPTHYRRPSVSGWRSEQSPPRVLHSAGSLLPSRTLDSPLKRKRDSEDDLEERSRPASSINYSPPSRITSPGANRLPSLSALCLPPIRSPIAALEPLRAPSDRVDAPGAPARRVPSFAMLLHPL